MNRNRRHIVKMHNLSLKKGYIHYLSNCSCSWFLKALWIMLVMAMINLLLYLTPFGQLYSQPSISVLEEEFTSTISHPVFRTASSPKQPKMKESSKRTPNRSELLGNDFDDYHTLMDMDHFEFVKNEPYKCRNTNASDTADIFMIIFVHSAPDNYHKRSIIRRTWASYKPSNQNEQIRLVFMIGIRNDQNMMNRISMESNQNGDIIQGNFQDTYRNITYKHIMGLKWISYYCSNVSYVLKTDDDVFVDLYQMTFYLKATFGASPNGLMACYLNRHSRVSRSYRNKWRVSFLEYGHRYFPNYCAGWSIIMSPDIAIDLYRISRSHPFFWIDDVFVSGILANELNIEHYDIRTTLNNQEEQETIDRWLAREQLSIPPMMSLIDSLDNMNRVPIVWNRTIEYYRQYFNVSIVQTRAPLTASV